MRLASLFALLFLPLAACTVSTTSETDDEPTTPREKSPAQSGPIAPTPATPKADPPDDGVFREVVSVFMTAKDGSRWMCTGTLVAADKVVTAAHCLDTEKFASYEIVASLADGKPRVAAKTPKIFGGPFADVANPDVGFLTLVKPVSLPRYAELTNVVADVEAKKPVQGAAVVRVAQDASATFAPSASMRVSSTAEYGYEHGFGTPMFSKGGDSGAGLFLVEDGKITHKLIGIARQPEPVRDLDHFTRISAAFEQWYLSNSGG